MEINQAAQTFLLFFFIFASSLVGLGFHLKFKKKSPKISLANSVETSILVVGIFTLLVFGGSYYFVLSDANLSTQPLKDALSITASFFGGFATLTAAYIASRLFNDWREQHNKNIDSQLCLKAFDFIQNAEISLTEIRRFMTHYILSNSKQIFISEFNENIEKLEKIADDTSIVFSNFGHFIPLEKYNEKFKPQFEKLIKELEMYIKICRDDFRYYKIDPNTQDYINKYYELTDQLRAKYRATFVELNEFYKAR